MQSTHKKSFQLETDSHLVLTTYQPSHISFRVTDKLNATTMEGVYYDSTLPSSVKQEVEAVCDLYDYLKGKTSSEMFVEGRNLLFNVVRIKKERWYSLAINDIAQEEKMEVEKMDDVQDPYSTLMKERNELISQNKLLKQEIQRLQTLNQKMQQAYQSKEVRMNIQNDIKLHEEEEQKQLMEKEPDNNVLFTFRPQPPTMRRLILTYSGNNEQYTINKDKITKNVKNCNALTFEECKITSGEKVYFSIQLDHDLFNDWIVFGVKTKELVQQAYCYFLKGCICYSGSIGNIFNEKDVVDVRVKLKKGDRLRLRLNKGQYTVEWFLNDVCLYEHQMSLQMREESLYPYMALSQANESVWINSDE